MDQLKDFLKQCVKYRFWIAFGVSILLPMIGYFVGSGAIVAETTKQEAAIKSADTEIKKYTASGIINAQYQPEVAKKKEVLTQDVDATWRKLFATQEPLLRWPVEVEERFRKWGRKYPAEIDPNQVQLTIIDYTIAYPEFVSRIFKIFKPFNFEDGSGIVVAPDEQVLLTPAAFSQDNPPDLGKVWAEQERIWVVTALLDVVAKVNDSVQAKDWDSAIIKQLNLVEVGAPTDQDQVSLAKGDTLVPADVFNPDGTNTPVAEAAPASPMGMMMPGGGPGGPDREMGGAGMGRGGGQKADNVYYLKTEGQQYKILPIKMNVLVEQSRLQDFLVGLENSPMAIEVKEFELGKPLTPVVKPVYGERSAFGMMGGMGSQMSGMMGEMMGGMRGMAGRQRGMMGGAGAPGPGMRAGEMGDMMGAGGPGMMRGGMMGGGAAVVKKQGTSIRGTNKAEERKNKAKEAAKAKPDTKKVDQYFNVIEVTVYGQARFYLAPPAPPQPEPSTASASPTPAPEEAKVETPAAQPTPAPSAPDDATKKTDAPQAETPKAEEAKPEPSAPKADAAPVSPDTSKAADAAPKR